MRRLSPTFKMLLYFASGNYMELLGQPYKRGTPCTDCPESCSKETKLCTLGTFIYFIEILEV